MEPQEFFTETDSTRPSKSQKRQLRQEQKDRKSRPRLLEPRSPKQAQFIDLLNQYSVVFALGAAGSGKTYVAARHALQNLDAGRIERIVITRPTVSVPRHRLGFQPGNVDQKMAPWMVPVFDAFKDGAQPSQIDRYRQNKQIEILGFEHIRGRTIKNGVFILDEAQNCTVGDLETFLTRIGENGQAIICGDPMQSDLGEESGLVTVASMVAMYGLNAGIVEFGEDDVVRSVTAAEWVKAFNRHRKTHGIPFLNR